MNRNNLHISAVISLNLKYIQRFQEHQNMGLFEYFNLCSVSHFQKMWCIETSMVFACMILLNRQRSEKKQNLTTIHDFLVNI